VEAGAHPSTSSGRRLQQGAYPPVYLGLALRRLRDAGEDLEPCTEPAEVSVVFPAVRLSSRRSPVAANACPEPVACTEPCPELVEGLSK